MEIFERNADGKKGSIRDMDQDDFEALAPKSGHWLSSTFDYRLNYNFSTQDIADAYTSNFEKHHIRASITYDEDTHKMRIESDYNLIILLPVDLASGLGFMEHARYLSHEYVYVELTEIHDVKGKFKIESAFRVNLKIGIPQTLLVYTSCVEPSIVGNALGQYLTHVPFNSEDGKSAEEFVSINPEYHKLNTTSMERINFKILRTDGRKLQFATQGYGHQIFFTLIFRRLKE